MKKLIAIFALVSRETHCNEAVSINTRTLCFIPNPRKKSIIGVGWHQHRRTNMLELGLQKANRSHTTPKSKYKKKQQSLESLISLEIDLQRRGYKYIIGCDDTGGADCVAGPVVVAGCCLLQPFSSFLPLTDEPFTFGEIGKVMSKVNDSKVLTQEQRVDIYETVLSRPDLFAVALSHRSSREIDDVNLFRATQLAFAESIERLVAENELPAEHVYAIVDGKVSPKLYASERALNTNEPQQEGGTGEGSQNPLTRTLFPVRPYVNADAEVYTVALSSIIARVYRDRMMVELHEKHPAYGFDRNRGFGSRSHIEALHRFGAVEGVHRQSFKQVKGR